MQRLILAIFVCTSFIYVHSYKLLDDIDNAQREKSFPNEDEINVHKKSIKKHAQKKNDENSLERVMLAHNIVNGEATNPDYIDKYVKQIVEFFKTHAGPVLRAMDQKYDLKSEVVHYKKDKPSLKFEINTNTLIRALKDILKSNVFKQNFDHVVHKASAIYRALAEPTKEKEK